jgi:hypothetical protein
MSFLNYTQFLRESALAEMMRLDQENGLYEMDYTLNEGGAYGHLNHPFEDFSLTFADLKQMIETTVNGAFGPENFVQEKTDGQNIMISWKAGKLIAARNKGHLKNAGEAALDSAALAAMFAGRGDIETAYNAAMKDLTESIGKLSDADKTKFFDEGKKFASVEVITPVTQNTVPYGQNILVFHGVVEHDEGGNAVGEDKQAGRDLGKMIADANAAAQETFFVRGPQDIASKPFPNTKSRASYYQGKLSAVMQESGATPASTVGDYALGMGKKILMEEANKAKVELPEASIDGLARRIADIDKSYSVPNIKKDLGASADWFIELEKSQAKALKRRVYAPLESLFLEIGTEMMKNMSAFLSANPTAAAETMRKEIDATIAAVKTNGDEKDIEKLEHELSRVTAAGGLDSIVPTEGITFLFNGKLYKYTGIFAPLHQIRSILAYKK